MNIFALFTLLTNAMGYVPKALSVLAFIAKAVADIEAPGQTGEQKLASVLNDTEAELNTNFPEFAQPFETIAPAIEAAVSEAVALLNLFGLFKPAAAA